MTICHSRMKTQDCPLETTIKGGRAEVQYMANNDRGWDQGQNGNAKGTRMQRRRRRSNMGCNPTHRMRRLTPTEKAAEKVDIGAATAAVTSVSSQIGYSSSYGVSGLAAAGPRR